MATKRGKSLKPDEVETLKDAIADYRALAIQCSNTTFNFAQRMRGDNAEESTHQLVRDYDRAENRLIEVLKDTGLFRSLSERAEKAQTQQP